MALEPNLLPTDRNSKPAMWGYDRINDEVRVVEVSENGEVNTVGRDSDVAGRSSLNTLFWDKLVASRKPSLSAQFQYWLSSTESEIIITWSGGAITDDSMLKISTGASSSSSAIVQSTSFLRYIPAYDGYTKMTVVFSPAVDGSSQLAWLFDGIDGFYFWFKNLQFWIFRKRAGVEFMTNVDITKVFSDGSFDPTKWNIYRVTFAYLGFGPAIFEVMRPNRQWVILGTIDYPNTSIVTHIKQTHLPVRAEIVNTTNNTNLEMRSGSLTAGIIDGQIVAGGVNDPSARFFTQRSPTRTTATGVLMSFRNKTEFRGIDNRISALLKLVSSSSDGTKPVSFLLLKNPAVTSATWVDVNETDSVLEMSTDLVLAGGAETWESFLDWQQAKSGQFFEDVSDQNLLLPPWWVAVFYYASANTTDAKLSIRWAELF